MELLERTDIINILKKSVAYGFAILLVFFCFIEKITVFADVLDSFDSKPTVSKETTPKSSDESAPSTGAKDKNAAAKKLEGKTGHPATNDAKATNKETSQDTENTTTPNKSKPGKQPTGLAEKKLPINLSSDGVSALKELGTIELEKNVLITQGDLSLKSNKARVYFVNDGNEVEKIIADGDVQVDKFDEVSQKPVHASGKKMTFLNDKQIIILEGNAKISRGKDNMRGNMITYDIKTGQIKAEKIETVVYPDENQIKKP